LSAVNPLLRNDVSIAPALSIVRASQTSAHNAIGRLSQRRRGLGRRAKPLCNPASRDVNDFREDSKVARMMNSAPQKGQMK